MDTVTCQTCWAELRGDNVDKHYEWHEALDQGLAHAREHAIDEPGLGESTSDDALAAPGPATPREELGEEFGEGTDSGARTPE